MWDDSESASKLEKYVGSHPPNTKVSIFTFFSLACDLVLANCSLGFGGGDGLGL